MFSFRQVLAVAGMAAFLIFSVTAFAEDIPLPTPVGRVVWVDGTFRAIMMNDEERILKASSVIYLNDTLVTDANSKAQIVYTDNTLMTFDGGTRFRIDNYAYDPKAKTKSVGKYVMSLIEGGFRTITGLIAKSNPSDYQVNTPVATIGVRGTNYAASMSGGRLAMAFYAGTPCVINKQGSICLTTAAPYATVSAGAAPVFVKTVPAAFKEPLPIKPAKIAATFTGGGGLQDQPVSTPSGSQQQQITVNPNKPITSFCITQ